MVNVFKRKTLLAISFKDILWKNKINAEGPTAKISIIMV